MQVTRKSVFLHFIAMDIVKSSSTDKCSVDMFLNGNKLKKVIWNCETFKKANQEGLLVVKDIGDGAIIGFKNNIEAPINLAKEVQINLNKYHKNDLSTFDIRIGLHSGAVIETQGFNGKTDWRGWGIVGVCRVMSFGGANHILASDWIAKELIALDKKNYGPIFHSIGRRLDKNGKRFFIYNVYNDKFGNPEDPTAPVVQPCDYVSYYSSIVNQLISIDGIKLPYIEIWSNRQGLESEFIDCQLMEKDFQLDELLLDKVQKLRDWLELDHIVGNRSVARLHHIETRKESLTFHFQETKYAYGLLTNFHLDVKFKEWVVRLRDLLAKDPLLPLESPKNKCSNHLGVSCIIETADKKPKIFLQKRSSEVAVFPNMIGNSAEGALGFESSCPESGIRKAPSPFRGILLEIMYELGIMPETIPLLKMMAVSRGLESGGKPHAFFVARTSLTFNQVKTVWENENPQDKWETEALVPVEAGNKQQLIDLIARDQIKGNTISEGTKANLYYYLVWKSVQN